MNHLKSAYYVLGGYWDSSIDHFFQLTHAELHDSVIEICYFKNIMQYQ